MASVLAVMRRSGVNRRSTAPKFLNLAAIRFPIGAIASILHRISGVLLLLALPLMARSLERSLHSEAEFDALLRTMTASWLTPLLAIGVWALAQHVFSGIRHMLMDVSVGVRLSQARASAMAAIVCAIVVVAVWLLFVWQR